MISFPYKLYSNPFLYFDKRKIEEECMKLYLAPLEGVTGHIYRRYVHEHFSHIDKYFTPFITPSEKGLKPREKKDILPDNNKGLYVVPQILTNRADGFVEVAKELYEEYGYREINFNLGCPSATVVTKNRGSGFLKDMDALHRFFDEIFHRDITNKIQISVKTRLGIYDEKEFEDIVRVLNEYPFLEVIVHARIQKDFYKYPVRLDIFEKEAKKLTAPVIYNGDIYTIEDYIRIKDRFPYLSGMMLGRGVMANPALMREIRTGKGLEKEEWQRYERDLFHLYYKDMGNNALFKMKELWSFIRLQAGEERSIRDILKAKSCKEYREYADRFFQNRM